jgi:hypothetical protein
MTTMAVGVVDLVSWGVGVLVLGFTLGCIFGGKYGVRS